MSAGKSFWEMDEMRSITGAMVILGGATALLVVMPYMLLKEVPPPAALKPYSDIQLVGRQSYIANGCVYCHSQQPRDIHKRLTSSVVGDERLSRATTPMTRRICWAPCVRVQT